MTKVPKGLRTGAPTWSESVFAMSTYSDSPNTVATHRASRPSPKDGHGTAVEDRVYTQSPRSGHALIGR